MILLNFLHSVLMLLCCLVIYKLHEAGVSTEWLIGGGVLLMTTCLTLGDLVEIKLVEFFNRESMQDSP